MGRPPVRSGRQPCGTWATHAGWDTCPRSRVPIGMTIGHPRASYCSDSGRGETARVDSATSSALSRRLVGRAALPRAQRLAPTAGPARDDRRGRDRAGARHDDAGRQPGVNRPVHRRLQSVVGGAVRHHRGRQAGPDPGRRDARHHRRRSAGAGPDPWPAGGHRRPRRDDLDAGAGAARPQDARRAERAADRHGRRRRPERHPRRAAAGRGPLAATDRRDHAGGEARPRQGTAARRHGPAGRAGFPDRRDRSAARVRVQRRLARLHRAAVAAAAGLDRGRRQHDRRRHDRPDAHAPAHRRPGVAVGVQRRRPGAPGRGGEPGRRGRSASSWCC